MSKSDTLQKFGKICNVFFKYVLCSLMLYLLIKNTVKQYLK